MVCGYKIKLEKDVNTLILPSKYHSFNLDKTLSWDLIRFKKKVFIAFKHLLFISRLSETYLHKKVYVLYSYQG